MRTVRKTASLDLTNPATKDLTVNLNGSTTPAEVRKGIDNTASRDNPATYLEKANFQDHRASQPSHSWILSVGEGWLAYSWKHLIRPIDNGSSQKPALPPVEKLSKGLYLREVDLAKHLKGKSDKELLGLVENKTAHRAIRLPSRCNGAKDGKPDLTNLVWLNTWLLIWMVWPHQIRLKSLLLTPSKTWLGSVSYLDKAKVPGPFLAGVNQVSSVRSFWQMACWLALVKACMQSSMGQTTEQLKSCPWLLEEGLAKGQYFHEVTNGNNG